MVKRIVYKKFQCQCNCQDDIDNLISEGTLYLISALSKDDNSGNLEAYLYICIVDRLRTYIKKWNRERKTVKADKCIHKQPDSYDDNVTPKLWLLDELERHMIHPQAKKIFGMLRQGYSAKDIQTKFGKKYRYSYTYNLINYTFRKIAVRIMKQRSMGIIDSQWMFNDPKFD